MLNSFLAILQDKSSLKGRKMNFSSGLFGSTSMNNSRCESERERKNEPERKRETTERKEEVFALTVLLILVQHGTFILSLSLLVHCCLT